MSKWVEDPSYFGFYDIDKRFVLQIGFFVFKQMRFVKYPFEESYTVYSSIIQEISDNDNLSWHTLNHHIEKLSSAELFSLYPEFNILGNTKLINKVVNNIKQILNGT